MTITISLSETANLLDLHRSTVREILRRGELPYRALIPREVVEKYAYGTMPPIEDRGL